jgi:hypothetical protein
MTRQHHGIRRGCASNPVILQGRCGSPHGGLHRPFRRPSVSRAPDNRTALAVAFFGSGQMVIVAVQAPALIPARARLAAWAALYVFLRPCPFRSASPPCPLRPHGQLKRRATGRAACCPDAAFERTLGEPAVLCARTPTSGAGRVGRRVPVRLLAWGKARATRLRAADRQLRESGMPRIDVQPGRVDEVQPGAFHAVPGLSPHLLTRCGLLDERVTVIPEHLVHGGMVSPGLTYSPWGRSPG